MRLYKHMAAYGTVVCISIFQASCIPGNIKDEQAPVVENAVNAQSVSCLKLVDYYSELVAQGDEKPGMAETTALSAKGITDASLELHEAIRLSVPGSKQQNDKEALVLFENVRRAAVLSDSDLQFNSMLLQHVTQRQELRSRVAEKEKRLVETETQNSALRNQLKTLQSQLDQLKDIEVEIGKKERSLTTPVSD